MRAVSGRRHDDRGGSLVVWGLTLGSQVLYSVGMTLNRFDPKNVNPLAPIALNGATLAAFSVDSGDGGWHRVTVSRECTGDATPFVVRAGGAEQSRWSDPIDAMGAGLALAGWLETIVDSFENLPKG